MDLAIVPSVGDDAVEILKAVLGETQLVLAAARAVEIKNESLVQYLKEFDHEACQAEDLLDELDYHRIRKEVEHGGKIEDDDGDDVQLVDNLTNQMSNMLVSAIGEDLDIFASNAVTQPAHHPVVNESAATSSSSLQIECYAANPVTNLPTSAHYDLVPQQELNMDDILCRIAKHVEQLSEMSNDARKMLKLDKLDSIALEIQSTATNPRETTSYVTEAKVYGRDQERDNIVDKLTSNKFGTQNISVVAVVGNGGIGKTTLARLVYNNPRVAHYFQLRLWIYVSVNFDEVKLTRELLECLYGDRYEGIEELEKLQEKLEIGLQSKKLLLVMDNVWEDRDKSRWDRLLAPFKHREVEGSVILLTTRKLSVVKMIGTMDAVELDGLKEDHFWHLFKECAFGDEKHAQNRKLQRIGREIVKKLKGYPLAAKSIGPLLKRKLDAEHWRGVLESDEWKYQEGSADIIPALKVSYKYLPFHLQRCFSYCALFPKNYWFHEEQLVNIWIAQGFVDLKNKEKRKEDVGSEYLNDLVECGFFLKEPPRQAYLMHDLIHDLAQMVSSDECFTIDGQASLAIPRLVRHVSIITESEYRANLDGSIEPNENFIQEFVAASRTLQTKNLSTLLLIGGYDSSFAETFRNKFDGLKTVRVLKLEMIFHDVDSLVRNLSTFIHLRYLELAYFYTSSRMQLPDAICKLYHLEVLDIKNNWGRNTDLPRDMSNLVNLRHFIAPEALHAKISGVGKLIFLQELKAFHVKKTREFRIGQLKELKELRESLSIYNLENLESREEAAEARLKEKIHLTGLHLSWDATNAAVASKSKVLEELQPHPSLKSLQIDQYRGAAPTWLSSNLSLTSLQSLHLEDCRTWRTLPSLEQMPFLNELRLVLMPYIRQVHIGDLQVLELRHMPRLEACVMLDKNQSSTNLRILEIVNCRNLRELPLLLSSSAVQKEHHFPHLRRLQIQECPQSSALPALPLGDKLTEIDVCHEGSIPLSAFILGPAALSDGLCLELHGGANLNVLDERILAFHNLSDLRELEITSSPNLTYLKWEGFQQLIFLKRLTIQGCSKLFSSFMKLENQDDEKYFLPPSLKELEICRCDITGKQLSQLLSNLTLLSSLKIGYCEQITSLAVGLSVDEENSMEEGSCCIPRHCLPTLEKLDISYSNVSRGIGSNMVFVSSKALGEFVSLKELVMRSVPQLLSSMVSKATLEENECSLLPLSLKKLQITDLPNKLLSHTKAYSLIELDISKSPSLTSLGLHSCTALQNLKIEECMSLASLKGLQSLTALTMLTIVQCPALKSVQLYSCTSLQYLSLENCVSLSSFDGSQSLTSLTKLKVYKNPSLASLKLHSCMALEKLIIDECPTLASVEGMRSLINLKYMRVWKCPGFSSAWNSAAQQIKRTGSAFSLLLESCDIDDINILTVPICSLLSSLITLKFLGIGTSNKVESLTDEHEKALQLLTSLKELSFSHFDYLQSLPAELHRLTWLEKLKINYCPVIMSLPEKGLPYSLKALEVSRCSNELIDLCRHRSGTQQLSLYINGWEA